ncbi:hypothetical protein CITRIK5_30413 [Citricoccus sp. K5]|nr:hypothetical protein CITRIK5_30413 [Citricoccus sp. K5]
MHVLPAAPHTMALGTTRIVNTDQTIRFGSVRYSTPPGLVGSEVWVRAAGSELVGAADLDALPVAPAWAGDRRGLTGVARHRLATPGNPRIDLCHYPNHPQDPDGAPRPPRPADSPKTTSPPSWTTRPPGPARRARRRRDPFRAAWHRRLGRLHHDQQGTHHVNSTITTSTASAVRPSPPLPEELTEVLKRVRLPHLRAVAPDVLATATAQRWDPTEVLRVLLAEEIRGRDEAPKAARRKAAALPSGKRSTRGARLTPRSRHRPSPHWPPWNGSTASTEPNSTSLTTSACCPPGRPPPKRSTDSSRPPPDEESNP